VQFSIPEKTDSEAQIEELKLEILALKEDVRAITSEKTDTEQAERLKLKVLTEIREEIKRKPTSLDQLLSFIGYFILIMLVIGIILAISSSN